VREEGDWKRVPTEQRQWRTAAAQVKTRAREGRPRLAYKRAGRSVGIGRDVSVPLARVGRPRAWPVTCAAPAANGAPWAVRRPADQHHLAQPLSTDGTRECSPALHSGQRSHRPKWVRRVRRWSTWPRKTSRPNASRRSRCCLHFTDQFSKLFFSNFSN
jgi:hypothetical protein